MGNKKKFDKIELNEAYYETHLDENEPVPETKKEKKNKKIKAIPVLNEGKEPEKAKLSSRFTYTREKRKVVHENEEKTEVNAPSKAPYVCALVVLCLVFVMRIVCSSSFFLALSLQTRAVVKIIMYFAAYAVPSLVFLLAIKSKRHLHNIRRFSAVTLPFSASCLGLLLCLTALQKYLIAYTFSYSEPTVASDGGLALSIVAGALLPALCEELFVRGILQHEISEYAGGLCGILIGAFVFAMLHFELQYFVIYFVAGVVLGSVTHVTGSVFPAMAVHFFNNVISLLFSEKLSFVATERIGGTLLIIVLATLCFGFLILTLHLAEKISEKRSLKYLEENTQPKEAGTAEENGRNMFRIKAKDKTLARFFKAITNPAMLVAVAFFIVVVFAGF